MTGTVGSTNDATYAGIHRIFKFLWVDNAITHITIVADLSDNSVTLHLENSFAEADIMFEGTGIIVT